MTHPKVAGLPFYIAAFFYSISYCYTKRTLSTISTKEIGRYDCMGNKEETLTLLDSGEDLVHADGVEVYNSKGNNWSRYGAEGTANFGTSDVVMDFPSSFPGIPI